MSLFKKYFLTFNLLFAISFCNVTFVHAQDTINVLVKVYDLQLIPASNLEITIQDAGMFQTGANGIAFISVPEALLPPSHISISDQKLEVESWNYSKGMLEIIVRKKNYKKISINITDLNNSIPLSDIEVNVKSIRDTLLISDVSGNIILVLPNSVQINDPDLFSIEGYRIARKSLDEEGGTLVIEEIKQPVYPISVREFSKMPGLKDSTNFLNELNIEDLDSITSLTVFYSLITKTNYDELDSVSKKKLDDKFNQLASLNTDSLIPPLNTLALISDSSIIIKDIVLIMEKIQSEELLLSDSREEFDIATNQIKAKLTAGGTKLNIEERNQLIQLIIKLQELLRNNEELFYKNDSYYKEQLNSLISQVANVYELEDLLIESEETYSEVREQLIYTFLASTGIIGLTALLIYLVRILRYQKNELTQANKEIVRINSNLEGLVAKKTISLEIINKELDTFLYRSSHNLRRPLTSIRGLANIAKISLNDEGIGLFDKVVFTIKNMENLLDKLAVMNHINEPKKFSTIDLVQMTANLRSRFSDEIEQINIQYHTTIPDDIEFKSYPFVVELILYNLLENAFFFCKFTRGHNPQVDLVALRDQDDNLCITIRDNGYGVHPDYYEKIWEMFFIANDRSQGNGLGLYITKKAIDSLNGTITLDTKYGKYCEFNILLPALTPNS